MLTQIKLFQKAKTDIDLSTQSYLIRFYLVGFMLLSKSFEQKNVVITGGNSGIGLETARGLYSDGHHVIIGSRNTTRNAEAVQDIIKSRPDSKGQISSFELDLSKRKSIQAFAEHVNNKFSHIDILVNNAGLILNERQESELGVQMTYTINHFGHFYLTYLLFNKITKSEEARIINVSSTAHYQTSESLTIDPSCSKSWSSFDSYCKSKLANVMFTTALADRLTKYKNIKTASLHPGVVASQFGRGNCMIDCFRRMCCCIYIDNQAGATTSLFLSRIEFEKLQSGSYYDSNTRLKEMKNIGRDRAETQKLWQLSQKLYQIKFNVEN